MSIPHPGGLGSVQPALSPLAGLPSHICSIQRETHRGRHPFKGTWTHPVSSQSTHLAHFFERELPSVEGTRSRNRRLYSFKMPGQVRAAVGHLLCHLWIVILCSAKAHQFISTWISKDMEFSTSNPQLHTWPSLPVPTHSHSPIIHVALLQP